MSQFIEQLDFIYKLTIDIRKVTQLVVLKKVQVVVRS